MLRCNVSRQAIKYRKSIKFALATYAVLGLRLSGFINKKKQAVPNDLLPGIATKGYRSTIGHRE
jgi:hypothetical protein